MHFPWKKDTTKVDAHEATLKEIEQERVQRSAELAEVRASLLRKVALGVIDLKVQTKDG